MAEKKPKPDKLARIIERCKRDRRAGKQTPAR